MNESMQQQWQARYEQRRLHGRLGRVILWTLSIAFTIFLAKHVLLAFVG